MIVHFCPFPLRLQLSCPIRAALLFVPPPIVRPICAFGHRSVLLFAAQNHQQTLKKTPIHLQKINQSVYV